MLLCRKQLKEKTTQLTDLQNTSPEANFTRFSSRIRFQSVEPRFEALWERDLDAIVCELDRMDEEEAWQPGRLIRNLICAMVKIPIYLVGWE